MKSISEVDLQTLKLAWRVLERDLEDGTRGILVVPEKFESDERGVARYDLPFGMQKVKPKDTVPQSYLSWATTRSRVEEELQRRGVDPNAL